jgi:hypothetical protein
MALTFAAQPDNYVGAYGYPVYFTLTSTNVAQSNFNYIADVYINGSATRAIRYRFPPNPSNNYGYIDIAGTLQSYLTRDFDVNETTFQACSGSIIHYAVQFGEEYGPSSGITQYPNIQQKTGYATNAVRDFTQVNRLNDWHLLTGALSQFLTNVPRGEYMNLEPDEPYYLYFVCNSFQQAFKVEIKSYDESGTLLNTCTILNPYNGLSNTSSRMIRMMCGKDQLNTLSSGSLLSGSAPAIPSTTEYYTLQILNSSDVAHSEKFYIRVADKCSKQTPIRFYWMNKLGGYDGFTFYGSNGQGAEIERNFYKKPIAGSFLGEAASNDISNSSRGESQYQTTLKDKLFANSDWITKEQSTWLEELFTSPDVFIYRYSDDLEEYEIIPVNIKASRYDRKTLEVDGLFNLTVEYEYSFNRYRQRR